MEAGASGGAVKEGGGGGGEEGSQSSATAIRWKPNEQCLEMLLAMGIDRNSAIKGLYYTGNYSAEFAASYVFDNPDPDEEADGCMRILADSSNDDLIPSVRGHEFGEVGDEVSCELGSDLASELGGDLGGEPSGELTTQRKHYKMVFVVNSALNMGPGKIAAQVSHASIGLYRRVTNEGKRFSNQVAIWEQEGEKLQVLKGEDDSHLIQLEEGALSANLETFTVRDTEGIQLPQGIVSLLAIFGREDIVNLIIENLPLL